MRTDPYYDDSRYGRWFLFFVLLAVCSAIWYYFSIDDEHEGATSALVTMCRDSGGTVLMGVGILDGTTAQFAICVPPISEMYQAPECSSSSCSLPYNESPESSH